MRHWRGTLPSNTLSCLHSLTEDVVRSGELGSVGVRVELIDEIVSRVDPAALGRRHRRDGAKVVVGLVGVQTNQFPRAQDLARQFKAQGFDVIIGGFHVSGAIAMSPTTPPECQDMLDAGVTLVLGEVEGRWGADPSRRAGGPAPARLRLPCDAARACRQTAAAGLARHAEAVRHDARRDHRRRPWLSVFLLVLHDHQRPGPEDAVSQGDGRSRSSPGELLAERPHGRPSLLLHRRQLRTQSAVGGGLRRADPPARAGRHSYRFHDAGGRAGTEGSGVRGQGGTRRVRAGVHRDGVGPR